MNKKVIIVLLVLLSSVLGINNVKATEGENQQGSTAQFCMYCEKNNLDNCHIAVLPASIPADEEEARKTIPFRLFKSYIFKDNGVTKYQTFESHSGDQIEGQYTVSNVLYDAFWGNDYVFLHSTSLENHAVCKNLFYTFGIRDDLIFLGDKDRFYFIMANEDKYTVEKYMESEIKRITTWGGFLESSEMTRPIEEFELIFQYGIDTVEYKSAGMKNKVSEIYQYWYFNKKKKQNKDKESVGCAILTKPIKDKINWGLSFIKYGGAALAIILGMFDFFKATLSDEDNANKKAFENFIKRIIAAILIFLLPLLIQLLFTAIDNPVIKIPGFNVDSPTCGIGESE